MSSEITSLIAELDYELDFHELEGRAQVNLEKIREAFRRIDEIITAINTEVGTLPTVFLANGLLFRVTGAASVSTKVAQALMPSAATISYVKVYSDTAPVGSDLIVDVNKNGVTIFTVQSKRPQVADGSNADNSDTPDIVALVEDDRVSVDIDQIGSGTAGGNDLLISVVFE